jgi:hypothetical protein
VFNRSILVLMLGSLICSDARAVGLAREGASDYVIVIREDASDAERSAADELSRYLGEVTGAKLAIVGKSDPSAADSPKIVISPQDLGPDGIAVKTVGRDVHLSGTLPRGPLYAVYTFLENHVGIRWWTSAESTIPRKPTLTIGEIDIKHTPRFRYREIFHRDAMTNPAFAARLKLNGHHHPVPPKLGGHYTLIGWCHTHFHLIPPSQYFSAHPEWFAQKSGKRQGDTQLCLSNGDMRRELIKNARALVRKNPDAGMISISQNDGYGPCECDDCQRIVKEEGSESALVIRVANEAAAAINKEFPGFLVETLAYVYSRKPPKITRPSENVLVRLCSIECDFTKPLASESNKAFGDDLRGWSAIAPNLFIWNYVTNFSNYLIPHPNLPPLADDLRFFADHNVVGVFQQADATNSAGDFLALRAWVQAKLLWDPSLDPMKLRDEFLTGYFADAAPHLAKYLALLDAKGKSLDRHLGCYNKKPDFLTDAEVSQCAAIFDAAEKSVAADEKLLARVRRERIVVDHLQLLRYDFAAAKKKHRENPQAARDEYHAAVREWAKRARDAGVQHFSEALVFEGYVPSLLGRVDRVIPPELPPPGARLPPHQFDIQEDRFHLHRSPQLSHLVDDAAASNGRAAKIVGGTTDWAVQFHVPSDLAARGPWDCHLVVRADAERKQGIAFRFGVHDVRHRVVAMDDAPMYVAGDGAYHIYTLSVDELTDKMYFWLAAPGDAGVKAVYVDRIFLSRGSP